MPGANGAFGEYSGPTVVLDVDGSRESRDNCAHLPRASQVIGHQHHDTGAPAYDGGGYDRPALHVLGSILCSPR